MTVTFNILIFHISQGASMDNHDDNIFDDDDALDYIMSEEVEQGDQQPQGKSGCMGVIAIIVIPFAALYCGFIIFTI